MEYINDAASFLRSHNSSISIAWTASFLVLFGPELTSLAKKVAKSWNFVFRVLFFIIVCGFAYGILGLYLSKILLKQLNSLDNIWLLVATCVSFVVLGIVAERKNKI